jgi:hypothetical protein
MVQLDIYVPFRFHTNHFPESIEPITSRSVSSTKLAGAEELPLLFPDTAMVTEWQHGFPLGEFQFSATGGSGGIAVKSESQLPGQATLAVSGLLALVHLVYSYPDILLRCMAIATKLPKTQGASARSGSSMAYTGKIPALGGLPDDVATQMQGNDGGGLPPVSPGSLSCGRDCCYCGDSDHVQLNRPLV